MMAKLSQRGHVTVSRTLGLANSCTPTMSVSQRRAAETASQRKKARYAAISHASQTHNLCTRRL